ncbi:MAG: flagellar export protein FliJ [Candidatus Velthaea sp.]|jgi:flagellar FliJ protein
MSRFRFRLQPVLEVRERVVDECQRDLALKARDLLEAETVLANLARDREARRDALTRDHRSFGVEELRAAYAHLAYLDRSIDEQTVRVAACGDEVTRAQAKLMAANTDRKVLETLRTRRHEAFRADAALVEQREVDDQNARRYGRAQNEKEERA